MATIHFRASPSKRTCGLLIVGEGARLFRLLVLPRFWAVERGAWLSDNGQILSVVAPEGAEMRLELEDGWRPLVEKSWDVAGQVRLEADEDENAELAGDDEAAEVASQTGQRWVKMPLCGPSANQAKTQTVVANDNIAAFEEQMEAFDALLRRASRRDNFTPLGNALQSRAVVAGGEGKSLLRLMLAYNGLTTVIRKNLHRIRRAYIEVTEAEPLIRGRITQRGLATIVTRSALSIECTHDEFSELTPLFRLLMTALERVAHQRFQLAEALLFPIRGAELAASLRSQLLAIPSMSLQEASVLAPRMQLRGRLRAEWQDALDLARIVLAPEQATQFDVRRMRESGAALQVVTSTFWEEAVMRGAFEGMADKKGTAGEVWAAANPKQPDCVVAVRLDEFVGMNSKDIRENLREFFSEEDTAAEKAGAAATAAPQMPSPSDEAVRVVFDAKYAEARGSKTALSAPSSGYQYQMLAYSLLADNCVAAALVHPAAQDAKPRVSTRYRRMVPKDPSTARECHLLVVEHPFPSAKNCDANWSEYLRAFRRAVGESFGDHGE